MTDLTLCSCSHQDGSDAMAVEVAPADPHVVAARVNPDWVVIKVYILESVLPAETVDNNAVSLDAEQDGGRQDAALLHSQPSSEASGSEREVQFTRWLGSHCLILGPVTTMKSRVNLQASVKS